MTIALIPQGAVIVLAEDAAEPDAVLRAAAGMEAPEQYTEITEDTWNMTTGTYRVTRDVKIESSRADNGLRVEKGAKVLLYIDEVKTLTVIGRGSIGVICPGYAGILLPEGSTLTVAGKGTLNATGGDGGNGLEGNDAYDSKITDNFVEVGYGGRNDWYPHRSYMELAAGGCGAGAGIGTDGGYGGVGGAGGEHHYAATDSDSNKYGNEGEPFTDESYKILGTIVKFKSNENNNKYNNYFINNENNNVYHRYNNYLNYININSANNKEYNMDLRSLPGNIKKEQYTRLFSGNNNNNNNKTNNENNFISKENMINISFISGDQKIQNYNRAYKDTELFNLKNKNDNKKELDKKVEDEKKKGLVKKEEDKKKKELIKLEMVIEELTKRIKELEETLEKKDKIISKLKKEKDLLNEILKEKFSKLTEQISKNEKMIKEYELKISQFPFKFSPGEKIMSIIFISLDENIISSFICKNTDTFDVLENMFYEKYSEYKGLENKFFLNGKEINRNKSLDENKIKNNDIIIISI